MSILYTANFATLGMIVRTKTCPYVSVFLRFARFEYVRQMKPHHTTNSEFEKNETPTTATTNRQNNNRDRIEK